MACQGLRQRGGSSKTRLQDCTRIIKVGARGGMACSFKTLYPVHKHRLAQGVGKARLRLSLPQRVGLPSCMWLCAPRTHVFVCVCVLFVLCTCMPDTWGWQGSGWQNNGQSVDEIGTGSCTAWSIHWSCLRLHKRQNKTQSRNHGKQPPEQLPRLQPVMAMVLSALAKRFLRQAPCKAKTQDRDVFSVGCERSMNLPCVG